MSPKHTSWRGAFLLPQAALSYPHGPGDLENVIRQALKDGQAATKDHTFLVEEAVRKLYIPR